MIYHKSRGRKYPVTEVILHTSATTTSWHVGKSVEAMRHEIDGWHRQRRFAGIGYHRLFAPDGSMALGRSIYKMGAHVRGHNAGTIGLCMVPSLTHAGITRFEDYFTEAQRVAVKSYIAELAELTDIRLVTGHNQYANKECPGFKVVSEEWMP